MSRPAAPSTTVTLSTWPIIPPARATSSGLCEGFNFKNSGDAKKQASNSLDVLECFLNRKFAQKWSTSSSKFKFEFGEKNRWGSFFAVFGRIRGENKLVNSWNSRNPSVTLMKSIKQSIKTVLHCIDTLISQSINQSKGISTNVLINQSINQSIDHCKRMWHVVCLLFLQTTIRLYRPTATRYGA